MKREEVLNVETAMKALKTAACVMFAAMGTVCLIGGYAVMNSAGNSFATKKERVKFVKQD